MVKKKKDVSHWFVVGAVVFVVLFLSILSYYSPQSSGNNINNQDTLVGQAGFAGAECSRSNDCSSGQYCGGSSCDCLNLPSGPNLVACVTANDCNLDEYCWESTAFNYGQCVTKCCDISGNPSCASYSCSNDADCPSNAHCNGNTCQKVPNSGNSCPPTFSESSCVPDPVCGNGFKEQGENCDDGNIYNADGCTSSCNIQFGWICSGSSPSSCIINPCGNGIMDSGETCDEGSNNNVICVPGYGETCTYCDANCQEQSITDEPCDNACTDDEICLAGICQEDPCDDVTCALGLVCSLGECKVPLGGRCGSNEECLKTVSGLSVSCSSYLCGGIGADCSLPEQCFGDTCDESNICGTPSEVYSFNAQLNLEQLEEGSFSITQSVSLIAGVGDFFKTFLEKVGLR
jgi:cysteine-rich repeat protein